MLEKNAEKENKPADVTETCFLEEISIAKEPVKAITSHIIASTEVGYIVIPESVLYVQELSDFPIVPKYKEIL